MFATTLAPLLASLAAATSAPPVQEDDSSWTVFAERVYTSTGKVHENAVVLVEDGKIRSVLPGRSAPRGALTAHSLTAGMVDASARVHEGMRSVEQTTEMQPADDVRHSIDLFDPRFDRLARSGVTVAHVAPYNRNVVGGQSVVLKTAGAHDLAERELDGRDFVCGAFGSLPSSGNSPAFGRPTSFFNRRPTTRMGVEWEWRKAFYDAVAAEEVPERDFEGAETLRKVLAGELGLFVEAWATQDVRTAVYLVEEMAREGFGEIDLVLDAAAEAWKEPEILERSGAAVVLPPFPGDGRTRDGAFMPLDVARQLVDLGVTVALSAHDGDDPGARLAVQAGLAMRGGLTREEALEAVTVQPARILGVDERVGTVEVGKDADLVLWSGEPFAATSRVVGVLVDGRVVLDPR